MKVLNTINFAKSMHYNPFQYIRSEKDILKLVNALIANTKGDGEKAGELRGVRPFLSDKYDITRHMRYRMLSDANPKYAFHIETYLRHRLHVQPDDVCEVYEYDASSVPQNDHEGDQPAS